MTLGLLMPDYAINEPPHVTVGRLEQGKAIILFGVEDPDPSTAAIRTGLMRGITTAVRGSLP